MPLQANRLRPRARSISSDTIDPIMPDELAEHLDALARDDCYRVDAVLKEGAFETTQRVFFVGANGAEQGPYVRKYLDGDAGLGAAYERIWKAQRSGSRFLHLPRIVDCYAAGAQRAVVMEYVQGETLADTVYRCDPSLALACDVFPKLCDAVTELHEGFDPPLIHRDLKPSNVMLTSSNLTIIDFGISRTFSDDADEDTRHFGTRAYAPPEQFGYGQTDVRSDVYALGMLLYFCLTERTPDAKARRDGYASERIPEPVRRVIARAAAFDPADRYAGAAEAKRAFLEAVEGVAPAPFEAPAPQDAVAASPVPAPAGVPVAACAPAPSYAASSGAADALASSSGTGLWARIPRWVGIVWDVVVLLVFALFFVVVTQMVFAPDPGASGAAAPLPLRAFSYYSLLFLMLNPVFYLLADRRPLRRLLPPLRSCTLKRELAVCAIVMLVGFFVVGISAQFFPPV